MDIEENILKIGAKSMRINEHRRELEVMMNFNKDCRKPMKILQNHSTSREKHRKFIKIDDKLMRIDEKRGQSKNYWKLMNNQRRSMAIDENR